MVYRRLHTSKETRGHRGGPAARALDSGIHLASANQLGDYPEARFCAPGHVYGPDGMRISRRLGTASIAPLDPTAPELWRRSYGDTLVDRGRVVGIGEGPLVVVVVS